MFGKFYRRDRNSVYLSRYCVTNKIENTANVVGEDVRSEMVSFRVTEDSIKTSLFLLLG